jgi:pyridoxamine 5'-phosphate oxidase
MEREFPSLSEEAARHDPFEQFGVWFDEAKSLPEPTAMALSTCSTHSAPSSRMVLLKEWDARGFVFYTNYSSRKGNELEHNPHVALLFFWPTLQRQIRIEGQALRCSREESAAYFRTRPRGAQIGAWASEQSTIVTREDLQRRVAELDAEYVGREVPVPPFWGGFRVVPTSFEFWQGRAHRLHDRLSYTHDGEKFRIRRLAP